MWNSPVEADNDLLDFLTAPESDVQVHLEVTG
jgi:hypothetical protein